MSHAPDARRKPFLVMQEDAQIYMLASFDNLDEAIGFATTQRLDRKVFVLHKRRVVWPKGLKPARRRWAPAATRDRHL
jgi:hypothetical protein